jgi:hypothetical protein
MKKIKRFNEAKKEEETQEITFDAKELVDKDVEPGFTTSVEDQEKVDKAFKKEMDKIVKFENFITINIDNIENIENIDMENELEEESDETLSGDCACCDNCTGEAGCECGCPGCECVESDGVGVINFSEFTSDGENEVEE